MISNVACIILVGLDTALLSAYVAAPIAIENPCGRNELTPSRIWRRFPRLSHAIRTIWSCTKAFGPGEPYRLTETTSDTVSQSSVALQHDQLLALYKVDKDKVLVA